MKTRLLSLFALLTVALTITSCLDSDDENTLMLRGHFTIEGTYPSYTLYHRDGYIVRLSPQSVTEVLGATGFGSHKRVFIEVYYTQENISEDPMTHQLTISNANLGNGSYVDEADILTIGDARDANLTAPDSIAPITAIGDVWAHRGFLNVTVTGPYLINGNYIVQPTMSMAYDPESVADDALSLTLLYNRHTSTTAQTYSGNFITAYRLSDILPFIPGNDSISVTVNADGVAAKTVKIGRR